MKPFRFLIETLNGRRRQNKVQAMIEYQDVLERRLRLPVDTSDQQHANVRVRPAGTGYRRTRASRRLGKAARAKQVPAGAPRPV